MNQQIIYSIIDAIKYKYLLTKREQDQNNIGEIVIISLFLIIISYTSTNLTVFEKISEKLFSLFVYKRYNSILLEGKRCFRITNYNTRSDQLFSNRFKAIWYYLAKNNNNNSLNNNSLNNNSLNNNNNYNDAIYSIKEFADSSNIYDEQGDPYSSNRSNRNQKRLLDMYVVNQPQQFLLCPDIFCKVSFKNDIINGKSQKKTDDSNSSKIEIINLEIFSYKKSLDAIKQFIDKISLEFISEIHNTRLDKKFIYTLLGKPCASKYDDDYVANRYSDWEECEFRSSRRFNNLFFENKAEIIAKIRFFNDNRDWYEKEGHPWTFGLGLSGPPGTGKTSIIKCIANMLNRHIIVIPLNKIKTQREFSQYYFENRYNANNTCDSIVFDNKIIVFEDIDCMTDIVNERNTKDKDKAKANKREDSTTNILLEKLIEKIDEKTETDIDFSRLTTSTTQKRDDELTLSYLLNIIDGLRETPGRIIIISSNNYDALDSALVRPGRIDYTMKMNNASKNIIEEMFSHYYNEPMNKYYENSINNVDNDLDKQDINSLLNNNLVSPAEIVNIKLASDSPQQFIEKLFALLKSK